VRKPDLNFYTESVTLLASVRENRTFPTFG
jgi:hypothetical protein